MIILWLMGLNGSSKDAWWILLFYFLYSFISLFLIVRRVLCFFYVSICVMAWKSLWLFPKGFPIGASFYIDVVLTLSIDMSIIQTLHHMSCDCVWCHATLSTLFRVMPCRQSAGANPLHKPFLTSSITPTETNARSCSWKCFPQNILASMW